MKEIEAKIIVFFGQVQSPLRNATACARKLKYDYVYLTRVIRDMVYKGQLRKVVKGRTNFLEVTSQETFDEAKEALTYFDLDQQRLK